MNLLHRHVGHRQCTLTRAINEKQIQFKHLNRTSAQAFQSFNLIKGSCQVELTIVDRSVDVAHVDEFE